MTFSDNSSSSTSSSDFDESAKIDKIPDLDRDNSGPEVLIEFHRRMDQIIAMRQEKEKSH